MVKNLKYEALLKEKTNFDSAEVFETILHLSKTPKYKLSKDEMHRLKSLDNYQQIKHSDPNFYNSKISYYEWNASEFMSEYFISSDVKPEEFIQDARQKLGEKSIKTKFILNHYSKPIMDACREDILLQANPIRRFKDGSMNAIFLCPADKSDGVKFIGNELQIPNKEILIAGNDDNDISLAKMSADGSKFICLNNSSEALKKISNTLKNKFSSIFISSMDGAKGILEGINRFVR